MAKTDPEMSELEARIKTNDFRAQQSEEVQGWLESMIGKMLDVRIWRAVGGSGWITEKHVADESTIMETIRMALDRHGAKSAVYGYYGRWALQTRSGTRYYDTQEAAEMVAMHGA